MTFRADHQPAHDRAEAARKAQSPWRTTRTVDAKTLRLHDIRRAAERAQKEPKHV